MSEKRMGRAIELGNRDKVAAGLRDVKRGIIDRRLSAGDTQCINSALQRGHPTLQHSRGWVCYASVPISIRLQVEQCRSMVGAIELIGNGLIDRYRDCFGSRIDLIAVMNSDRLSLHACESAIPAC